MIRSLRQKVQSILKSEFVQEARGGAVLVSEYTLGLLVVSAIIGGILLGIVDDTSNSAEEINRVQMDQTTLELSAAIKSVDQSVENMESASSAAVGSKWSKEDRVYTTVDMPDPASEGGYRVDIQPADGPRDYTVSATTSISEEVDQRSTTTTSFDVSADVEEVGGLSSGRVAVRYNASTDTIEIEQLRGEP